MRVKLKPQNIFFLCAIFLTIILSLGTYFVAREKFQKFILNSYQENLSEYTNAIAPEYFDLSSVASLKKDNTQDKFLRSLIENSEMSFAQLTDANGLIIASTNSSDLGGSALSDPHWKDALVNDVKITKTDYKLGTIDIYIPIKNENDITRGIVIATAKIPSTLGSLNNFTNLVTMIVFGASIFFTLVAYLIMYELEENMKAKERSIFDQSKAQTEEKRLYEAITTSLAEALIVINKNSQIMFINPEAEKMIGEKSSDLEYRSYTKNICFCDENGKKIRHDIIEEALTKGHIMHITSKDGYYIKRGRNLTPVAINIAPIVGDKSVVKGVALTINDIGSEKELQKVKDEFVYVVAHELGNPIFALDGYLSLLKDHSKKMDKQSKDILSTAQSINLQLSSLVNDLLEVARNETGRLTFDIENIDLAKIATEVADSSQFKAREKDIKLMRKLPKKSMAIGNERKMKEVITNLLDNAIKYTPKGGHAELEIYEHDDRIILEVKDSGIGISKENQIHLFEKFYRVKNKATEGISGTGLGLFIAKQIVEKCGGKIWAVSDEGKGTTVSFSLKPAK